MTERDGTYAIIREDACQLEELLAANSLAQLMLEMAKEFHAILGCCQTYAALLDLNIEEYVIGASVGEQSDNKPKSLGSGGGLMKVMFDTKKPVHITSPSSATLRWDIPNWLKEQVTAGGSVLLMPIAVDNSPAIVLVGQWNDRPTGFATEKVRRLSEFGAEVANAFANIVSAEVMAAGLRGDTEVKGTRPESQWARRLYASGYAG